MMRKIRVETLIPGMLFSDDVFLDEATLFVAKGIPVSERDMENLRKWKISTVLTNGQPVQRAVRPAPAAPAVPDMRTRPAQEAVKYTEKSLAIRKTYGRLADEIRSVFEKLRNGEDINAVVVDRVVDSLFGLVQSTPEEIVEIILTTEKPAESHAENALNTSLISLLIGQALKLPNHRLIQLVTGALLHDIGMVLLPDSILKKKSNLGDDEFERIKEHPVQSNRIITKMLKYPEDIGRIALNHHERWDGEGYPSGLKGEEIHLHARIVSVADAFDAMVSSRPYRDPMIGYTAMKSLLSDNSRRFDPSVLKVFINSFGIYPIGSIVLLSDSRIGRVTKIYPDSPIRPRIRILSGAHSGDDSPENTVDLHEEKQLFIVRAVNPVELKREQAGR